MLWSIISQMFSGVRHSSCCPQIKPNDQMTMIYNWSQKTQRQWLTAEAKWSNSNARKLTRWTLQMWTLSCQQVPPSELDSDQKYHRLFKAGIFWPLLLSWNANKSQCTEAEVSVHSREVQLCIFCFCWQSCWHLFCSSRAKLPSVTWVLFIKLFGFWLRQDCNMAGLGSRTNCSFAAGSADEYSRSHHLIYPLCASRWGTTDDFTTSFLHFSLFSTALELGLGELQACPFPDVVFPPLLLSALSSSPFHCT